MSRLGRVYRTTEFQKWNDEERMIWVCDTDSLLLMIKPGSLVEKDSLTQVGAQVFQWFLLWTVTFSFISFLNDLDSWQIDDLEKVWKCLVTMHEVSADVSLCVCVWVWGGGGGEVVSIDFFWSRIQYRYDF